MASTTFAPSFSPLFSGTVSRPLTKSIKRCSVFFLRRLSVKALANNDRSVDVQVSNNRGTYGSSLDRRRSSPLGKSNSQSTEQKWVTIGVVTESLPNGMFWVELENKEKILGYISGRIRKNSVRVLPGDRVKIEVNRYDTSRARIVYRIGK